MYGRTKPGTLLKHHIPVQTERWNTTAPGFTEIDLVSHSGDCAAGEFVHSLNVTDIHTTWVETRAVLGKSQERVRQALEMIRTALPFPLRGIDSDNGSEFINGHLYRYCQARQIQFTRGRPYKKDDNAHIEQKNWTHVRKLIGYDRYDSPAALTALNALYGDLRLLQNLWLPSVKLVKKTRVGSRLRRRVRRAADAVGAGARVSRGGSGQGRGARAAAEHARSVRSGGPHRGAAGSPLCAGESSPRRAAYGRCRTCGKRPDRVSHKVLGKPQERVFHSAPRPSSFSPSKKTKTTKISVTRLTA